MNLLNMSCFCCSSCVGNPRAFCLWSNLEKRRGRGREWRREREREGVEEGEEGVIRGGRERVGQ